MASSKLVIEIEDDGTVTTNATQMVGTEKEILAQLEKLAASVGGDLKVEKHEPGVKHHHHGGTHHHH